GHSMTADRGKTVAGKGSGDQDAACWAGCAALHAVYNGQYTTSDNASSPTHTTTTHQDIQRSESAGLFTHGRAHLLGDGVDHGVHLVVLFQVFRDEGAHGNDPHPGVAGLGQRAAYQNAAQSTATEILTDLGVMEDALV